MHVHHRSQSPNYELHALAFAFQAKIAQLMNELESAAEAATASSARAELLSAEAQVSVKQQPYK